YLTGQRLGVTCTGPLEVISWNENQVIDKNFYKGLKEAKPEAYIWGCRSFIAFPPVLNHRLAPGDKKFHMHPDCLLMNSRAQVVDNGCVSSRLGVSFRSGGAYTTPIQWDLKTKTII